MNWKIKQLIQHMVPAGEEYDIPTYFPKDDQVIMVIEEDGSERQVLGIEISEDYDGGALIIVPFGDDVDELEFDDSMKFHVHETVVVIG